MEPQGPWQVVIAETARAETNGTFFPIQHIHHHTPLLRKEQGHTHWPSEGTERAAWSFTLIQLRKGNTETKKQQQQR